MMEAVKEKSAKKVFNNWIKQVSANSRSSYSRVVPEFFEMACSRSIEELDEDSLEALTPNDVYEKYISVLKEEGRKDSTIANYLSIVRSFIKELEDNRMFYDIDYNYLTNTALSAKRLKNDGGRRGKMTGSDYEAFMEWLLNKDWSKRYSDKGEKYSLALKFMFITAIRINSTFKNIHWYNIKPMNDESGNFGYMIEALDKGEKINRKPITEEFYHELKEVLYRGSDEDLVFGELSKQSFTRMMHSFSKETGREVTPHSIKVGAGTALYRMTKDLIKVQRFLDHADPKVTLRYIRTGEDITDAGSFILSSNITIDNVDELEYNELVRIIKSRPDLAYAIIGEAKKGGLL